jgi:hypothetical protein
MSLYIKKYDAALSNIENQSSGLISLNSQYSSISKKDSEIEADSILDQLKSSISEPLS